ncbi:hypothetical protein DFQ28_000739 [Apophysomyces sp. BC1034]|nr:hypothetical protein DFQ30_001229 [Apophysomyces sp. BC1015]KAG0167368.1 hypothetical protein DFQ29_000437 [Apophysomyces sp. BC1021]KAG0183849.1 hypothetical protein DFQ28_000739 [Apophysomyces sp. BC1034]
MAHPQIFKATYSGVPVYEMLCKGIAVMRRRSDSYLNATQILKVADFDKPQRTRILEREVQTGEHEKVQGGYGKYQGTWVPFDRGIALAQQYQVDRILQPILEFVKGDDSPPLAPKHVTAASTRPRKPREPRRKRAKRHDDELSEIDDSSQYSDMHDNDVSIIEPEQSLYRSDVLLEDTRRGKRSKLAEETFDEEETEDESEYREKSYAQKLLQYFISDDPSVPPLLQQLPRDLDVNVIIDDEGHTSLHWAAALGRINIVKLLVNHGADIYRVNYKGQTALMRSVLFTNNFDIKSFQQLLEMLQQTIFNIDKKDQTVFHHVAATASWKGKVHASRYYMDCLVVKLANNRSELISILNVQDVYGDTALTIASRIGNKKLVRLLVDAGASGVIANEEGMTSQDYLAEIDRVSRPHHVLSPSTSTSHNEQAARTRLRQKVESMFRQILANDRSVPAVSQLFDGFAGSYERDLAQKEQLVREKKIELELVRQRLAGTQHSLDQIQFDPRLLTDMDSKAYQCEKQLRRLMQCVQKEKLTQMIHGEEIAQPSPTNRDKERPSLHPEEAELLQQFKTLQQTRQKLVDEIIALKAQTPGKRYQDYKRLISMCCNVAYENVDVMLSPLLASFEETDA